MHGAGTIMQEFNSLLAARPSKTGDHFYLVPVCRARHPCITGSDPQQKQGRPDRSARQGA